MDIGENLEEIGDTLANNEENTEENNNTTTKTTTTTADPTPKLPSKSNNKKRVIGCKLGLAAAKMGFGVVDTIKDKVDIELEGEELEKMKETAGK